jgi:RES domain-containing protein
VIAFRHVDSRFPFLWESDRQPGGRWHAEGEGPVHYFADTPDGAWAELLRHEEITEEADVATIRRALWAVELPDEPRAAPRLPAAQLRGGLETYETCRAEARRLRASGASGLIAPSAALRGGEARGWRVRGGLEPGKARTGKVIVLFGRRPGLTGWSAAAEGHPHRTLLAKVRPLASRGR